MFKFVISLTALRPTFCRLAPRHTNIKLFFGGGNTKTKMRSIYLNVAEAKK